MFNRRTMIGLSIGLAVVAVADVRGDHRHQCDCIGSLATELQQHGRALSAEFRSTYRSTPQYGALQCGARELSLHGARLQSLARSGASVSALHCELREISCAYRGLVATVRAADLSCGPGYPGQAWLYGHVESRNPQVQRLLQCVDQTICKIQEVLAVEDIAVRRPTIGHDHHDNYRGNFPGQSGWGRGAVPHGPPTAQRNGFSISNGRLTFQFGR